MLLSENANLLGLRHAKRLGLPCEYGCILPGLSVFGDQPTYLLQPPDKSILVSGVYQRRRNGGRVVTALIRHMIPKNPRTEGQQANRQKIADGVEAWQNLTSEQKEVYNVRTIGKKMSGYNLFLREYLKSH